MTAIPYGEGWPYPKLDARVGTVYRVYDDNMRDLRLVLAVDMDGSRRGVEVSGQILALVLRPRARAAEPGIDVWGDADAETLLQAAEAWRVGEFPCGSCGATTTGKSCTACAAPLLARALFRTDKRAMAFVDRVSDAICYAGKYEEWDMDLSRQERAWETAWQRNEGGLRTESERRARDMLHEIRTAEPCSTSDPTAKGTP